MADQWAVVTKTVTGTGLVDFTDPSITEDFSAALFLISGFPDDDTDNSGLLMGIGAVHSSALAASNDGRCVTVQGNNASLTAPDYNTVMDLADGSGHAIKVASAANNADTDVLADYDSDVAGGVRLNFTTFDATALPSGIKITALIFAGLDAAQVGLVSVTENFGISPFKRPNVVITFTAQQANPNARDATICLGFAVDDGSDTQVSAAVRFVDTNEPTEDDGHVSTTRAAVGYRRGSDPAGNWEIAFTSTGFTAVQTAPVIASGFLALKFSGPTRFSCIAAPIAGSTGRQNFPGFGFRPGLAIGMSTLMGSTGTDLGGALTGAAGLFVTGDVGSRAITGHAEDGKTNAAAGPFNTETRMEDVALLTYDDVGAIAQRATWDGGSLDGFDLNFSVATAGYLVALGIQAIPSPAPEPQATVARPAERAAKQRRIVVGGRSARQANHWLQDVLRSRRSAQARLRPAREVATPLDVDGEPTDDPSTGRVFQPGLARGRVQRAPTHEMTGQVFSPGVSRARIKGPGVATPDIE